MTECAKCGKALKPIGTARVNGKQTHPDWATRKYHKKCWKEERSYSYMFDKCQTTEFEAVSSFRDDLLDKILH